MATFGNPDVKQTVKDYRFKELPMLSAMTDDSLEEDLRTVEDIVAQHKAIWPACKSALLLAVCARDLRATRTLVTKFGHDINEVDDVNGWTAALTACGRGDVELLTELRNLGADLGRPAHDGGTCAHAAAQEGHLRALRLLHEAGCDLETVDANGTTPAFGACQEGHLECLRLLKEAGADLGRATDAGATAANIAAQRGHVTCLHLLLLAGCDMGAALPDGSTPARQAAQNGHVKALELLITSGADLNKPRSTDGTTPAFAAAANGHFECLQKLANANADLGRTDKDGAQPAFLAAQNGHLKCLRVFACSNVLVRMLAQPNSDANRLTPAHGACKNGHLECLQLFKEIGCLRDVAASTREKAVFSLAHAAASGGSEKCLKYLYESGCDLGLKMEPDGTTALDLSIHFGHSAASGFLTAHATAGSLRDNIAHHLKKGNAEKAFELLSSPACAAMRKKDKKGRRPPFAAVFDKFDSQVAKFQQEQAAKNADSFLAELEAEDEAKKPKSKKKKNQLAGSGSGEGAGAAAQVAEFGAEAKVGAMTSTLCEADAKVVDTLSGLDKDWLAMAPGRLKALLVAAGVTDVSEKRLKGIKAQHTADEKAIAIDKKERYWLYEQAVDPENCCLTCKKGEKQCPGKKLITCMACNIAKYCSEDCQKRGWKAHKLDCSTTTSQRMSAKKVVGSKGK